MVLVAGAAESVMPRDMLQHEASVEGPPKKSGVKYVAACEKHTSLVTFSR